ncbi:MAG: DUF3987 domain-containing protein [Gammaproteobacteria bacterium]|nr:DUF3987 domain-containing protein [Gammaproteobacteria bacterium]
MKDINYVDTHGPVKSDLSNDMSVTSGSGGGDGPKQWGEIKPIKCILGDVEKLPLEIIPGPFQAWIKDVCYRMQCPIDFVAAAAITMTGSVIGAGCAMRPKQRDNWQVIPNLWGGVVGRPSILKTPALEQAMSPLSKLERNAKEKHDQDAAAYEAELAAYQANKSALQDIMRKCAKEKKSGDKLNDFDDAKVSYRNLEQPTEPAWARYKTNDSTIEKMGELLADNPRGILLFRDELVGLLDSWDREGREQDRAFYLEAWNGYSSYTTDRIGRGTVYTENLCVSVFGGIQPTKLISYLYGAANGYQNDGLTQRLQLLVYPDEPARWENIDQYPDHGAEEQYFSVIEKLAGMDFIKHGATKGEHDRFPYFRFTPEAQEIFNDWLTELQTEKLRREDNPIMVEHLGKYRSLLPSLALIFHLIDIAGGDAPDNVSVMATKRAAAWCSYLETHARRIYGLVSDIKIRSAEQLYKKIVAKKLNNGFTVRDVYRNQWHLLSDRAAVQDACDELIDLNVLKPEEIKGGIGIGKPHIKYLINPSLGAE